MNPPESNEAWRRTLGDWQVRPPRDPNFRAGVWARIAAARRGASWSAYLRAHALACLGAVALAVAIGGWVGREQALARVAADRAQLAQTYVQAMDARAMQMP